MASKAYSQNYNEIDWSKPVIVPVSEHIAPKRADLAAPGVISDTMKPVKSMLDGRMYDSKAALRATYKAAGVVEVGNDSSVKNPKFMEKKKVSRADVQASVSKAFSRAGLGA